MDVTPLFGPGAVERAHAVVDEAIATHITEAGKTLAGTVALISGGRDSTLLLHLMRERISHAGHCNTTIGIPQTRQFVRDLCAGWEVPLIEVLPPVSYRDLVVERGFPGPSMHWKMYQRLKERGLRQIRRRLVTDGRDQRVLFVAGRRRHESERRMHIPRMEREGSVVWVSPLWDWSDAEMADYRGAHEIPVNQVTEHLHMSGECLCGSFAKGGELAEIDLFYPEVATEIRAIEAEVAAAGHPEPVCRWGWGGDERVLESFRRGRSGRMCSSCEQLALWEQ
jgi:3'-phosphoadenosine 5'-phosphosulfate sulfotransferase (PAPS reductase)/FAD synthetase